MIHLITNRANEYDTAELKTIGAELSKGRDFLTWFDGYTDETQFDTETNVVRDLYGWKRDRKGKIGWTDPIHDVEGNLIHSHRECYVVQIGDEKGDHQWIFDVPGLKGKKKEALMTYLRSDLTKLMHNALFDYPVVRSAFDVSMTNIFDTYVMSKVLHTGKDMPKGFHALSGCLERYLGIEMSKEEQTTFTGEPLNLDQIKYAAIDVAPLCKLKVEMQKDVDAFSLSNVVKLENAVIRSYGDALSENFYLDTDMWRENIVRQQKALDSLTIELHDEIREYFHDECVELEFIQKEDHYDFKWGSPNKRKKLLKLAYPTMPDDHTTMVKYKSFLKQLFDDEDNDIEREKSDVLQLYLEKNFDKLEGIFIRRYSDEMKSLGIFTPKGEMLINFNSPLQTTQLFKLIDPKIESSGAKVLAKLKHPLATSFQKYSKASKLVSSYGENFIGWVAPDGQIRVPSFSQILNTGRSSMKLFQLIPSNNNDYRSCFKPNNPKTGTRDDGYTWKMAAVDYSSQEVVIVSSASKEPAMLEALEKGYDSHSISASLLFPDEWKSLGGESKPKSKPRDDQPELNKFRNYSKTTSFGIIYGISAIGLADMLNVPGTTKDLMEKYERETLMHYDKYKEDYFKYCEDYKSGSQNKTTWREFLKEQHQDGKYLPEIVTGDDLIQRFQNAYPKLTELLHNTGEETKRLLYTRTADPFGRIRFFDEPEYDSEYGSISRAAGNFLIQGSAANMTKYALVLIKNYLDLHDLNHKMKFSIPIHDELVYMIREDFADEGLQLIIDMMEKAGALVLGNDLQKAEGELADAWQK